MIMDAVRTPIGKGKATRSLTPVHPVNLLAHGLGALAERTALDPALIDDVIGGCVDQAGEQAASTTPAGPATTCEAGGLANATILERH